MRARLATRRYLEQQNTITPNLSIMAVSMERFVLPGESLDANSLPSHATLPLKLGPGLRHIPPNTITPTLAGQLCTDRRKNAVWVDFNGGRVCWIQLPSCNYLTIQSISPLSAILSLPQFNAPHPTPTMLL